MDKINDYSPENNNKQIMKIDCNKQCECYTATICEKSGNYIEGEQSTQAMNVNNKGESSTSPQFHLLNNI